MSSHSFPNKIVNKPVALDKLIRSNISWGMDFNGVSTDPLVVYFSRELTIEEDEELHQIVENYTDPAIFLVYDHSNTLSMYSHYTNDDANIKTDGKCVLQTFIYNNPSANNGLVLDSVKTIVEYACPNVQNFLNTTSGNISLSIVDITRNVVIFDLTKELDTIALEWNSMAATGSTESNTVFKSVQFDGLMNKTPNYDVIWQFRGNTSNDTFTYRCNSLQYLFYNVQ